jgi:indole-3-glycerol phosphate synthase
LSVLTEGRHFGGSVDDLVAVRAVSSLPVLRKDFIVGPAQVAESAALGADAVLLIAAALSDEELVELISATRDLGLAALVETHAEDELERALAARAEIIGVNSRDLETLHVDLDRALALVARLPASQVRVLESGLRNRDDVRRAEQAGADAVLVGEALMRSADPAAALRGLLGR